MSWTAIQKAVPSPIPADLDGDGIVNTINLGILLSHRSIPRDTPACNGSQHRVADINHDGLVNTLDLGILRAGWTALMHGQRRTAWVRQAPNVILPAPRRSPSTRPTGS